jgi:RND family efflux transporter MFP subunit
MSCGSDQNVELKKLKQERAALDNRIKSLEEVKSSPDVNSMDSMKFRFVGVSELKPRPFDHYIRVQGKLDGDNNAAVYASIPGTVIAKFADVGHTVKRGEVLAQVDDREFQEQVGNLETQYNFAVEIYNKQKRLWDQKIGSEVQYLQSKTNMESLEQQLDALREQIEKFKIKSPIDGTVEECNIRIGSVVMPDPRAVIYRVVSFSNLKVIAEVSEAYAARVDVGDRVNVFIPALNRMIRTDIRFVSRYINPVNLTFTVECRIPEMIPGMKANMISILNINDYHSENSLQIPMNVILSDEDGSYVFIARKKDNLHMAWKQPVRIGNTYNGLAETTHGLEANDKLIISGFHELIHGEYVRFESRSPGDHPAY